MKKAFFLVAAGLLALSARAQMVTNCYLLLPQTKLEALETNTGTVLVKAAGLVGTVTSSGGTLSIMCEEITDAGTGRTQDGLAIGISGGAPGEDVLLIDYEEIDAMVNAIDYLSKVDWSVTPLQSFDVVYSTKGGLRLSVFSSRRNGTIEFAVRTTRASRPPVVLSRDQVAQLRLFVTQGKSKLDSMRK